VLVCGLARRCSRFATAREREQEEARQEREQLHSIIEKQTYMLAAPKEPEPKKTFWQRLFLS
jgi:hypothetical protein